MPESTKATAGMPVQNGRSTSDLIWSALIKNLDANSVEPIDPWYLIQSLVDT